MNTARLPFVLASVDVEAAHGTDPFEQMIMGLTEDGSRWGVFQIAEILEAYQATGTFFVDVYQDVFWGEARMKKLCQDLVRRGHDVQLHTHPGWRYDPRDSKNLNDFKKDKSRFPPEKDFMAKLTLDEQIALIRQGKNMLESWIDKPVIAHRSGGYSINADTITALRQNGIYIDSSMNRSHTNSRETWSDNIGIRRGEMLELPVSYYRLVTSHTLGFLPQRLLKTDIDSTPLWLLEDITRQFEAKGIGLLQLFMHSFSLLDMAPDFSRVTKHHIRVQRLHDYLKVLRNGGWTVGGIETLQSIEGWEAMVCGGEDSVPDYRDLSFVANLVKLRLKREAKMALNRLPGFRR